MAELVARDEIVSRILGPEAAPPGPRRAVMVADDDPLIRRLITSVLSARYDILAVSDGVGAVEKTRSEQPDLIILDYLLPGIHGYEACRRIKADPSTSSRKVLILTAYPEGGGAGRAREVGADAFLLKPFSPRALLDAVNRLLFP